MGKDSIPFPRDPDPRDQDIEPEDIPKPRSGPENSEDKKNGKDDKKK